MTTKQKLALFAKSPAGKLIIAIVISMIIFVITRKLLADKEVPKQVQLLTAGTGGVLPAGWYPDDMAARLYDTIAGHDSIPKKEATFGAFNQLNDNQMIEVYNFWNTKYAHKRILFGLGGNFGTLTQALRDEIIKTPELIKALGRLEALRLP